MLTSEAVSKHISRPDEALSTSQETINCITKGDCRARKRSLAMTYRQRYNLPMSNSILDLPFILETRRNHALEHATLHMLAVNHPHQPMAGHSNPTGFFILGDLPTEDIRSAVEQALARLRAGESSLAIHPGCGTNLAMTALLSGTLAWFVLRGGKSALGRLVRIPFALLFAVAGALISRPLGPVIQQRITTDAEMGDLQVVDVRPSWRGRLTAHRVITK